MERNLNLDVDTIVNKEFSIEFKGYSPIEVDSFLDKIVQDYDTFQKIIEELNQQVSLYQNATDKLKARVDMPKDISSAGKNEKEFYASLDEMCEQAFDDQCTGANPRYPLISEIKEMYINAYNVK